MTNPTVRATYVTACRSDVRDVEDIAPASFELEPPRAHDLVGPYGAFTATMAPDSLVTPLVTTPPAASSSSAYGPPSQTLVARLLDELAMLPLGVWKRVALYSFLVLVFGNLLRCGGLSSTANVIFAGFTALGVAGVIACVQRNP